MHSNQENVNYWPGFVDALTTALDLDGSGRLLDLGCGPGTVTLPLARLFDEAVGVAGMPSGLDVRACCTEDADGSGS